MSIRAARRIPGIRFEAQPPQLDEILPRMDIAAFVGFAATGPVHVPVAVESVAEFEAIFGGDAPLAWDPQRGEHVSARLAPAVRAFFRNGGTRCWVVRAAERPSANFFPIPGLARLSGGSLAPAFARGRADGSWCDDMRLGAALAPSPVDVLRVTRDGDRLVVEATVAAGGRLDAGDLLRLQLTNSHTAMLAVADTRVVDGSPPSDRTRVRASGNVVWFRTTPPAGVSFPLPAGPFPTLLPGPVPALTAVVYTATREPAGRDETFASAPVPILNALSDWTAAADGLHHLDLQIDVENAPQPGALLSVKTGAEQLWLSVRTVGAFGGQTSGTDRVRVAGPGLWCVQTAPAGELRVARADRVGLELWARRDEDQLLGLRDLGLAPAHPRYWANLTHDNERYNRDDRRTSAPDDLADERLFPIAGAGSANAIYVPIDVALTPDRFLGAARQPRTALERDGLAAFSPALFVDPDLIAPLTDRVANEAEHIRYTAAAPRRLKGIHAVLELEEATILSVPDAPHRGWMRVAAETPAPPQPSPSFPPPPFGRFLDCSTRVVDAPDWGARFAGRSAFRFDSGTYTLDWQGAGADSFVVEEARHPDWRDAVVVHAGAATRFNVYGRTRGDAYYRVRSVAGTQTSNWSRGIVVSTAGADTWQLVDEHDYSADTLVVVQRALVRMAAARGDLVALLTMPEHYRAGEALAHVSLLTRADGPVIPVSLDRPIAPLSVALGAGEARAFSYGALYHPWLMLGDRPDTTARLPPDGSVAGLLADRASTRGAWIAPANEALAGVIAVSTPLARDDADTLTAAGVNVIRQTPRGFLPLSANTLSEDPDLALINVRRLLSLLRRLALREGTTYVFEPHDGVFERSVQRGFESLLTYMFERGAFAGNTTTGAFQVNTGASLNTTQSVEQGRFVVELRVAPSLPMSFLTVRLVQSGDRTLVTEER